MSLQQKVIDQLTDSLGDLEKQAIQALVDDSNKLSQIQKNLTEREEQVDELQQKLDEINVERSKLQTENKTLETRLQNEKNDKEVLQESLNNFEVDRMFQENQLLRDFSDRTLGILDNQTRFFTQTTKRQVVCLLYTSPSPRDATLSRMPSSA